MIDQSVVDQSSTTHFHYGHDPKPSTENPTPNASNTSIPPEDKPRASQSAVAPTYNPWAGYRPDQPRDGTSVKPQSHDSDSGFIAEKFSVPARNLVPALPENIGRRLPGLCSSVRELKFCLSEVRIYAGGTFSREAVSEALGSGDYLGVDDPLTQIEYTEVRAPVTYTVTNVGEVEIELAYTQRPPYLDIGEAGSGAKYSLGLSRDDSEFSGISVALTEKTQFTKLPPGSEVNAVIQFGGFLAPDQLAGIVNDRASASVRAELTARGPLGEFTIESPVLESDVRLVKSL